MAQAAKRISLRLIIIALTNKLNAPEEVYLYNFLKPSSSSGRVGALVRAEFCYKILLDH